MKRSFKTTAAIVSLILAMGAGFLFAGCSSASSDDTEQSESATQVSGAEGDIAAAQELIDQTVTRDEIESAVGAPNRFEMNSEGCDRGAYAGIYYYDNFSIFSITYDKGKTYTVKSVSE